MGSKVSLGHKSPCLQYIFRSYLMSLLSIYRLKAVYLTFFSHSADPCGHVCLKHVGYTGGILHFKTHLL